MSPEEQARRGDEARLLLENQLFVEVFEQYEQEITDKWQESPARDQEGREKLWLTLKCLHRMRSDLQNILETGQSAKVTLLQRSIEAARQTGHKLWPY